MAPTLPPSPRAPLSLEASQALCDRLAREKARNFYYGFRLLPKPKRLALSAMYAYFRACDDITDGDIETPDRRVALEAWRAHMRAVVGDDEAAASVACAASPVFPAFRDAVRRYQIPVQVFEDLIDGSLGDLDAVEVQTFDQLYRYCYCVASTVGLVCIHIFGFDGSDEARQLAEWCGIAFQLTNILRDVEEDARLGRIYLPAEDLARFGLSADDLRSDPSRDERFTALMAFEAARAQDYYERSKPLSVRLNPESRGAFEAMVGIYRGLLNKIVAARYQVFGQRIRMSTPQKLGVLLRALYQQRKYTR